MTSFMIGNAYLKQIHFRLPYTSKSAKDLNLKSVKKKFKDKKFSAGCSRDVIRRGADQLGWTLDDPIAAVQTFEA